MTKQDKKTQDSENLPIEDQQTGKQDEHGEKQGQPEGKKTPKDIAEEERETLEKSLKPGQFIDKETGEIIDTTKRETIIDGAEFWNFEEQKEFIGKFKEMKAVGDYMAYIFTDPNGLDWLILQAWAIDEAFKHPLGADAIDNEGYFAITFLGKRPKSEGKKEYKRFKVELL